MCGRVHDATVQTLVEDKPGRKSEGRQSREGTMMTAQSNGDQ